MYLELFKLQELPFRLTPDPAFLYLSKHHARAKAYMESTIWFTDGFVVITGEIGSGKTTLIETFLKELEKDVVVAQINQTQVSAIEFLQTVLVQFGFSPFKMKKAELLATLNEFLVEQYANGRRVLLIVDEAQNLSNKVLEEIRLLSGVETTKEKVLRIILAGQPELNDKLNSPSLIQLAQRIVLGRILVGVNGQTIAERELTPGRFIIGRTPDNDLQIDSKYISRHHAQIITSVHSSVLEDLNSTNGIYVRSKRVRRRMLNDGDVVQIGQHEIMYFDERTNRSRTAFHEIEDDAVPMVQDV